MSAELRDLINELRGVSNKLRLAPRAFFPGRPSSPVAEMVFPAWGKTDDPRQEEIKENVRHAAWAILSHEKFDEVGGGERVPIDSVADLLHYIADMMER